MSKEISIMKCSTLFPLVMEKDYPYGVCAQGCSNASAVGKERKKNFITRFILLYTYSFATS